MSQPLRKGCGTFCGINLVHFLRGRNSCTIVYFYFSLLKLILSLPTTMQNYEEGHSALKYIVVGKVTAQLTMTLKKQKTDLGDLLVPMLHI